MKEHVPLAFWGDLPVPRGRLCLVMTLLGALSVLLLLACTTAAQTSSQPSPSPSPPAALQADSRLPVITFTTVTGGRARLAVEVEAKDPDREHGLMDVKTLPADQGQIFIFQDLAPNQDVQISFWMRDTFVPLSIAFISADGRVEEIQDMAPQSDTLHTPKQPYRYAVEANQGWFANHGVQAGSTVDLSAALKGVIY